MVTPDAEFTLQSVASSVMWKLKSKLSLSTYSIDSSEKKKGNREFLIITTDPSGAQQSFHTNVITETCGYISRTNFCLKSRVT